MEFNSEYLLESLTTAVLLVNQELKITYVNLAAQTLLQQSDNQVKGNPVSNFILHSSLTVAHLEQAMKIDEGFSDGEVLLAFFDGRHILADVTVTNIDIESDSALLVEIKTIDQQRRISQESQQWSQQQAARELIRGLAHEIKNPLGGLRGAAQLLEKELPSRELQEFTQVIIEQADRLGNLVDRLLGPNSPPNFQWHNVHRVLEKIRTLAQLDAGKSIEIKRDYDPSIPDLFVDQDMLQQAVLNIVNNSIQALKEKGGAGRILLKSRIKRQQTIHGIRYPLVAAVKIIDNGPGIPEEIKDTLFYPMITGKLNGTGLGLSIAQTLVDHHKGKIEVESWPGRTEFKIYLPINKKDAQR